MTQNFINQIGNREALKLKIENFNFLKLKFLDGLKSFKNSISKLLGENSIYLRKLMMGILLKLRTNSRDLKY